MTSNPSNMNEVYLRRYLADVQNVNANTPVEGVQNNTQPKELVIYLRRYLADTQVES